MSATEPGMKIINEHFEGILGHYEDE